MEQSESKNNQIEIWGGVECSVVRINGTVHDQLKMNGHEDRLDDLDLFAEIGLKKLRYPLLWEKYASQKENFFTKHDARLEKLRLLNIEPIAGLLHHGSGPFETDMLQPEFPYLLAEYAYTIAKQYPWIEYYTPVNEPMTTARFSGLYGIWYPHLKDDYSFAMMYINEIKGIILSMVKIREINPKAKLVQTEDIARIHSTSILSYQANLENERVWLTYDILTGNFGPTHSYWEYFLSLGVDIEELEFFTKHHFTPAICGFNYYVTSERFLDDRINDYPMRMIGGNDFHDYVDIEVVRVGEQKMKGIEALLNEACKRYNLPVALTEIHLACTREEQLRWFSDAYNAVKSLKQQGMNVIAITAWSLLGSFDWNTLLQYKGKYYETGVFDIRSGKPRATAMSNLIKELASDNKPTENLLEIPGWWKRNVRISYQQPEDIKQLITNEFIEYQSLQPLIVFGESSISTAFEQMCILRGIPVITMQKIGPFTYSEEEIIKVIRQNNPWAIVYISEFSKIDEAEISPLDCYRENTHYPRLLAQICKAHNVRMLTLSSDQVFNGRKKQPYIEADSTDPINVYGMSKKIAEESILMVNSDVLIIRSSLLMNPYNTDEFLFDLLFKNQHTRNRYLVSDIVVSPAYLPDLINTALDLLIDKEKGIWHISGPDVVSYFDIAEMAISFAGISNIKLHPIPSIKIVAHAKRPAFTALRSASGIVLPGIEESVVKYISEIANYHRT